LRAIILVLDGTGAGEAPDAPDYGDAGSNTLGHIAEAAGGLHLPTLQRLGLGNIGRFKGVSKNPEPLASFGLMRELSAGKDTITGHWEMMGIINKTPFPTYPEGFPIEIIRIFEERTGLKVLGNKAASGTEIIKELGEEHLRTGRPIVYTSADSVFQIAAHVDVIPPEKLYELCSTAREILVHPHHVCRVIARPFRGESGESFERISGMRKDFALPPPSRTVIGLLAENGVAVYSVGKVGEMFSMRGFAGKIPVSDNRDNMEKTHRLIKEKEGERCLVFSNLTDFDTLYGHRNDADGFATALGEFDAALDDMILPVLKDDDYLFITADHGNDPSTPSTDHSREMAPIIFYNRLIPARDLGMREGFCDLGATVAGIFGLDFPVGKSFLKQ
jgi:phosphopentomutase